MRASLPSACLLGVSLLVTTSCGPVVGSVGKNGNPGNGGNNGGGNGGTGGTAGTGSGTGGTGGTGGFGGYGGSGGGGGGNADAGICGEADFTLARIPADLLIVLDKSGSMDLPPPAGGLAKWDQMTAAINQVVGTLMGNIRWGLKFFPSDAVCAVVTDVTAPMEVPISDTSFMDIPAAIAARGRPAGSTPTTGAMRAATTYLSTVTGANPKFILLATDGQPRCQCSVAPPCPAGCVEAAGMCQGGGVNNADDANAIQAVASAAAAGFHTFVIGIAADAASDGTLTSMAMAGLEPRNATPPYYPVANQQDLANALNAIAGQISSCTFSLTQAPLDPNLVRVTANGMIVPRDPAHVDGWDFGPNNLSIVFFGASCDQLRMGTIQNVHAIFGCPPVP